MGAWRVWALSPARSLSLTAALGCLCPTLAGMICTNGETMSGGVSPSLQAASNTLLGLVRPGVW